MAPARQAHAYRPSLAWAGDQGLIVGGLIDRTILEPKAYAETVPLARTILRGSRDTSSIPAASSSPGSERDGLGAPGGDVDDYMTGPGVFMRYPALCLPRQSRPQDVPKAGGISRYRAGECREGL